MAGNCNNIVGTLYLEGEDAVRFIDAFFRPSSQQIERMTRIRERIDNSTSTVDMAYGFQAIVGDLDLSFLEGDDTREYRVEVCVSFNIENIPYENTDGDSGRLETPVKVKSNVASNSSDINELLKAAA